MTKQRATVVTVAMVAASVVLGACGPSRSIVRGNWPDGRIESPLRGRYVAALPMVLVPDELNGEFRAAAAPSNLSAADFNRLGVLKTIHFDFNKAEVRPDQVSIVEENAAWLREHPTARIIVEGHCDERGTRSYNLALGQRRADATRDFLVSLGIEPRRLEVVSYGEELPAVPEHNEGAWGANRRGEFVIVAVESP